MIDNYDVNVNSTRRVRGAIFYDTDKGPMLLRELNVSEKRLPGLYELGLGLEKQGCERTERLIKTKEGNLFCEDEDGKKYILKKWFQGKECDPHKESEIMEGVRNLALLHRAMEDISCDKSYRKESLRKEYFRHNRELKKVRAFVRNKTMKGKFEISFLHNFDAMYEWALAAEKYLDASDYDALLEASIADGKLVHGDYNYHNILMTVAGVATTNFEHFHAGIPVTDLYYFLRKTMEKNAWDISLGHKMLDNYSRILPLTTAQMEYLAVCIAYPEKFWKVANSYYRSSKSWVSAKNLEKLETSILQAYQKQEFLEAIFSFSLDKILRTPYNSI